MENLRFTLFSGIEISKLKKLIKLKESKKEIKINVKIDWYKTEINEIILD